MVQTTYAYGVARTMERRFGFSSYQTGFINSCNDMVHLTVVIFVGYLGQKGNKPRIMCVTAMFTAVSGMLNASPHFLFPDQALNKSAIDHDNSQTNGLNTSDFSYSPLLTSNGRNSANTDSKYCSPFESENRTDSFQTDANCPKEESNVHPAYYVFIVSQIINGVGSAAIFTLSLAYIDENSPKSKASVFLGEF